MSDLSLIPLQDGFETQLSQDWDGNTGTIYVLATPSYTPTTTNTYIVVNPGKTNMQIAEITDYDSTAKTLTVSSISFEKGLGISSTAQSHSTGSKVIISDNYQFWEDIQTAINSKLDKNGGNSTVYATTAARDSALGGDGAATLPYTNIYVTATGLFYNYNLSTATWQSVSTGTSPGNATTSSAGLVRTDVAPAGIPVALIQDNPKYDALAGQGTPSSTNLFETQYDTSNGSTKTATTISFTSGTKTIADSGNGFVTAGFKQGTQITITGSASNNGTFTIVSVAAGAIVTAESLVNESAGASVVMTTITADKLVRYSSTSQVKVPLTPVDTNDAVSKAYSDGLIAALPTLNYGVNTNTELSTYYTWQIPILNTAGATSTLLGFLSSGKNDFSSTTNPSAGGYAEVGPNTGAGYQSTLLPGVGSTQEYTMSANKILRVKFRLRVGSTGNTQGWGLHLNGYPENIYVAQDTTANGQARFVLSGSSLYAEISNATDAESVDISSGITVTNMNLYEIIVNGTTSILFYVNGTLKATLSTRIPTGALSLAFGSSTAHLLFISSPTISLQL